MGLDGLELLLAVEERFGVEFSTKEMESIRSVQDLVDAVNRRLAKEGDEACGGLRVYHRLRAAIHEVTGASKRNIRLEHRLQDLLPGANGKCALEEVLGIAGFTVEIPYRPPGWLGALWMALAISCWMVLLSFAGFGVGTGLIFLIWLTLLVMVRAASRRWWTRLPHWTLRHLVQECWGLKDGSKVQSWEPGEVRLAVRGIICEQLAIQDDFPDTAEFVQDFHLD